MNITYRTDENKLYLIVEGRVDASNAGAAEEKISGIRQENKGKTTVIDADGLEYISSAGLRIILKLRREDPKLSIINVCPEVYEVLDMTGFTDMVKVEKALRRLSVEGCEFIAKGANGAVYRYDDETIVKTYFSQDALAEIQQERESARKAFILGLNTAIPYDIVRVGDGYGSVTELLNSTSVSKLIKDDPTELDVPAKMFVDLLKSIHAIEPAEGEFPSMKELALSWVDYVVPYLPADKAEKLKALVEAVPERNTLLHGDYHTNNILVQNGEPLLIDLDTLCMGHPVFELGSVFNAFIGFSENNHKRIESFLGYTFETSCKLWDMTLKMYLGTDDEAFCTSVKEKAMVIGYTRLYRRALRRPNDPESKDTLETSRARLCELLDRVDSLDF